MQATSRGAIAAEVVFCIGVALVVHVVTHWRWGVGITRQLLHKLPVRSRVYYALDATLLVAFASIISSGVMMSTAVLPLFGAQGLVNLTVVQVHRVAAYLALAWLGMKFVLHRTWLKNAIRRHVVGVLHAVPEPAFRSPALMPVPTTSGNTAKVISRRRFLLIGCSAVGVVWLAIINQTRQAQGDALSTPTEAPPDDAPSAIVAVSVDTPTTPTAIAELVEPISTPIAAVVETVEPTALPTAAAPQRTATRCPRGKVNDPYPGHCRHYVDKNGNGICDLSETA